MILEQALFHLPEILTGSGYPRQSYEGGIVGAFSLALLQSLNGRNIPNPISCLHAERPFRLEGWKRGNTKMKRYLRSDLHLDLDDNPVGSERLSAYGWRFRNWIEAKFFRKSTTNAQQNTAGLLADLLRLLALVPNLRPVDGDQRTVTGRYLLYIYEAFDPTVYLSYNRQIGGATEQRKWLVPLVKGGDGKCPKIKLSDYETSGVLNQINPKLGDLEVEFRATSWRIGPMFDLGPKVRQYVCILTRINSFTIARNGISLSVDPDRTITYRPSYKEFKSEVREFVGQWVNLKPGTETRKPDALEEPDEEEAET
jgi:hypothetical protein